VAKICIPVTVRHAGTLPAACRQAAQLADVIELRLDYLPPGEMEAALALIKEIQPQLAVPLIVTNRTRSQGGHSTHDTAQAPAFWRKVAARQLAASFDLEGDWLRGETETPWPAASVVASHHDFSGAPDSLEEIYQYLAATGAGTLKIAVTARDITDCLPVFRILERAVREERPLIALAMGMPGLITRILGPAFGSFLTFAALDATQATAPGQLLATELRELYRIDQITRETPVYGLLGWPVGHSLSPAMHNTALTEAGLQGVYLPLAARDLNGFMRRLARPESRAWDWNLCGLSVTAPHKVAILKYLDGLAPEAAAIGAANTVCFDGAKLFGHNTDAEGFITPLRELYGDLRDARCAALGAGGAARCAVWALRQAGADVTVLARDAGKARRLAGDFSAKAGGLGAALSGFDIVVNATPLGTKGAQENSTPAVAAQLSGVGLAYDLVYNPPLTPFLREAQAADCKVLGGLPMLIRQAAAQFRLWTGHEAPLPALRQAAERSIS
jgi:3-dehydroquinate dehydratase/shikimate dehydrogenase